ncbi:actin-binding protein WASF2-like [Ruditapes philippinarum]|uniref:actin-binding protein WASF2-like n=1 Tax=Ruditapes philippinarum TaxID=129788 RepID=UPI00295B70F8|nr:actin-binding protein WASF2-like [Ruditapes philippinarum]
MKLRIIAINKMLLHLLNLLNIPLLISVLIYFTYTADMPRPKRKLPLAGQVDQRRQRRRAAAASPPFSGPNVPAPLTNYTPHPLASSVPAPLYSSGNQHFQCAVPPPPVHGSVASYATASRNQDFQFPPPGFPAPQINYTSGPLASSVPAPLYSNGNQQFQCAVPPPTAHGSVVSYATASRNQDFQFPPPGPSVLQPHPDVLDQPPVMATPADHSLDLSTI